MRLARPGGWRLLAACGAIAAFFVLVTANSAGYRYGISDQAFYVPAIELALQPDLFPKDAGLLNPQSQLTVLDELLAGVKRLAGLELPTLFLAGYLTTIVLMVLAIYLVGKRLYSSGWSIAALGLALTLRHRIAKTGVNSFEGYFHPRVLTLALGLLAASALLRGRRGLAYAIVITGLLVHPTTGLWFAIWIVAADFATSRHVWRVAAAAAVATAVGAWLLWQGPLAGRLVVMDPAWTAVFSDRDYLFPSEWAPGTWLVNAIAPLLVAAVYRWRTSLGLVSRPERGLVIGIGVLLAVFLASLPFSAARVALAVQLQVSRVLWQVDLLATIYLVWALTEAEWPRVGLTPSLRQRVVVIVLALASMARGAYILRIEHAHSLVAVNLPATAWQRVSEWASTTTPRDAHFLVDPEHTWRYGVSFRIAAKRDVYLERAKDLAIAIYSRDVALRLAARTRDLGDFNALTPERVAALARTHDVNFLISEQDLALPVVHRDGPLRVYALEALRRAE